MKWHWSIFFLFGFIMFAGCASPQINEVVHPPDEATKIPTTTSSPVPVATATVEIALVSGVTSLPASPTASFAASPSEPVLGSLADAGQYWINTYGGPGNDAGKLILTTQDGGILIVSESDSFNRYPQTWLIKLAPNGSVLWQRAYDVHAGKVIETANGDIVVIGSNHMVRLDAEGNILWAKFNTFFGERYGDLLLFEEDTNGQLIVWNAEGGRMVMDANGEILTIKAVQVQFDTDSHNSHNPKVAVRGGGYMIDHGQAISVVKNGGVLGNHWQRNFSFADYDIPPLSDVVLIPASNSGIFISGVAYALDGYTGHYLWLAKMDSAGNVVWQGSLWRYWTPTFKFQSTSDGGVLIAVVDYSFPPSARIYLIRLNTSGQVLWTQSFFNENTLPTIIAMTESTDGSVLILGEMQSAKNGTELLILKTNAAGGGLHCELVNEIEGQPRLNRLTLSISNNIPNVLSVLAEDVEIPDDMVLPADISTMETHLTLEQLCVDKFAITATPTATAIPAPTAVPIEAGILYPIVRADGLVVGGTVDGEWLNAEQTSTLLPKSGTYQIFQGSVYLGEAGGARSEATCGFIKKIQFTPQYEGYTLAVGGTTPGFPEDMFEISPKLAVYQSATVDFLKEQGLATENEIFSIHKADLEVDGMDEVLVIGKNEDGISFAFMRKLVNGGVKNIPILIEDTVVTLSLSHIVDLNSDGDFEILLESVDNKQNWTTIAFEPLGQEGMTVIFESECNE